MNDATAGRPFFSKNRAESAKKDAPDKRKTILYRMDKKIYENLSRLIDRERPVWYSDSNVGKRYHMFRAQLSRSTAHMGGLAGEPSYNHP
jgi:hypothetical protein